MYLCIKVATSRTGSGRIKSDRFGSHQGGPVRVASSRTGLLFFAVVSDWFRFVGLVPHKLQLPSTEQMLERPIKYKTPGLQSSDRPPLNQIVNVRVAEHGKSSNSKGCRHVLGYKTLST